ncbi:MAG: hypothetical protein ACM3IK_15815 [Sphingomonadaceae bacterium]
MRSSDLRNWVCGCALAALHAMALAQAASWKPEFIAPQTGVAAQTAPLRIRVTGIPQDVPAHLAVELDDIDVTSLAALDGSDIVITPAQPIAFGAHTLRLVEYTPDGGIAERGAWSFEIRESAAFRQAQLQVNATANATQRVAEHNANTTMARLQGNGSAQLQGAVANEDWQAQGAASILANSQSNQLPRHEGNIDIGQYLLQAQRGAVSGRIGDQAAIAPDSLVMQGFARRGVSADVVSDGVARLTGFSVHTTPLAGSDNMTGVGDANNRVDGAVATLNPVTGRPELLALSGTYVDGEGTSVNGAGVAGTTQAFGGHAGSVVADSQLFDKLLRLRGEYADSSYDFDGVGTGLEAQSGHAYSALANYTPWHSMMVAGQPLVWNVGGEKRVLSTFFRSPANPAAIADRNMGQAFTALNWYGLSAQASAGREHDNVDKLPLLPTTETTQQAYALSYVPVLAAPPPGGQLPTHWFGQPSLNASYTDLKKDLTDNPGALPLAIGPLHKTTNLLLGAQFQYQAWSWGLGHNRIDDRDFAGFVPDTVTTSDRVQIAYLIAKLNLGASLQHDQTDNTMSGTLGQAVVGGITLGYPFTNRVTSSLAYTVRHAWADQPALDQITSDTTAALNWVVVPAKELHPGLSLGVDGSYHDCRDKLAGTASATFGACLTSYQAFLRLGISWMPTL